MTTSIHAGSDPTSQTRVMPILYTGSSHTGTHIVTPHRYTRTQHPSTVLERRTRKLWTLLLTATVSYTFRELIRSHMQSIHAHFIPSCMDQSFGPVPLHRMRQEATHALLCLVCLQNAFVLWHIGTAYPSLLSWGSQGNKFPSWN